MLKAVDVTGRIQTSEQIGLRLRRLREQRKIGLRELARRIDCDPNALSRLETGKRKVTVEWLTMLSGALGVSVSEILEDEKYEGQVMVMASACCNDWRESCWFPTKERYTVQVPPDSRHQDSERFAIEGRCPAMNLRYAEGSLIICVPIKNTSDGLVIGKRYLIESWRKHKRRKECELSVKKLTADDEGKLWFVTESSHPAYQMSIPFSDTGDVAIKPVAQVVGSMQLE